MDWLPYIVAILTGVISGFSNRAAVAAVVKNELKHLWREVERLDKINDKHDKAHTELWTAVNERKHHGST